MEDVRIARHSARDVGGTLHEVVVVGVDAGYHMPAELFAHHVGECLPLTLAERAARRQHHLEAELLRLDLAQQLTPKKHIVITLDVREDFPPRPLRLQAVGGFEVTRREVFRKTLCHKSSV